MAVRKKYAGGSVLGRGLDELGNGRGLDALIDTTEVRTQGSSNLNEIEISKIEPNPNQPRREFDETALQELANSIREIGIIQPITLRQVDGDKYQIIAGERRWRASQIAGLATLPAYIRTVEDEGVMEMALVENIQREDLNAIEIALAYEHLAETTGLTQEKISQRVGKSRTAVTNYLRLLRLPAQVQMALKEQEIDMGHARALINVQDPTKMIKLYEDIVKNGYSVRKVEQLVQELTNPKKAEKKTNTELQEVYTTMGQQLSSVFGTAVKIERNDKGKGRIVLQFANDEELEKLMAIMDQIRQNA